MDTSSEQQARIHALEDWFVAQIPRIWGFDARIQSAMRRIWDKGSSREIEHFHYGRDLEPRVYLRKGIDDPEWPLYQATIEALVGHFGADAAHFADYHFRPSARRYSEPRTQQNPSREDFVAQAACVVGQRIVARALQERRDRYVLQSALERARYLLRDVAQRPERSKDPFGRSPVYPPQLDDLRGWLNQDFPFAEFEPDCRELLAGGWNGKHANAEVSEGNYQTELYALREFVLAAMDHFQRAGEWSFEHYRAFIRLAPPLFSGEMLGVITPERIDRRYVGASWLIEYVRRLAWETLLEATAGKADEAFLYAISDQPEGARWLLQCGRLIEARGLGPKEFNDDNYDDLSRALKNYCQLQALAAEDDPDRVVAELRGLQPDTRWLLLMFAGAAQPLLFRALDIESLLPLHHWLERMRQRVHNSESLSSGLVDLNEIEPILQGIAEKPLQRYLKALKDSQIDREDYNRAVTLLDAVRGKNRSQIEKALPKHGQIAAKAYGLLPLMDADDARGRYVTLKKIWKECSRYGAERQANTRAAVTVGLANLAQRAGYRDAARMEWDMEAAIGGEAAAKLQPTIIEPWRVWVEMDGIKPVLVVSKEGKRLKSVPAGIKKLPAFLEIRQAVDELKQQASRFRRTLEQLMCDGEALPRADLAKLVQIPAVAFLLANLLGIDERGQIGLIDPATLELVDGEQRGPIGEQLRLAHGLDLLAADKLAHWQQQIVKAQMVQPFKQVFRELYVPTPAELDTETYSNRFAGHTVNGATAYRLLQGRGWSSFEGSAYKRFPEARCQAEWNFPDVRHYLAEDEAVTCDQLRFHRGNELLAIAEVPPLAFSEAMRDADLVVSVANIDDEGAYWSAEASRHRMQIVQEVARALGLKGLRFEDNFVHFTGKLASYRIHLGSGVIHIMPGSYLCIVPAPEAKSGGKFYLPFADTDRKTSEIISKLLLLLNDHKIKDETILAQIRRS